MPDVFKTRAIVAEQHDLQNATKKGKAILGEIRTTSTKETGADFQVYKDWSENSFKNNKDMANKQQCNNQVAAQLVLSRYAN